MAAKGELTRDVIDKVIIKMGEMSSGGNAAAMDTLKGKISNLSDAWHQLEDTLLGDKSEGLIKAFVSSVTAELNLLTRNMSGALEDQIAHAEARIKTYNNLNPVVKAAGYVGSLGQFDITDEERNLAALKDQKRNKDSADATIADQKRVELETEKALGHKADLDQKAQDAADKVAEKAKKTAQSKAESAAKAYASEREAVAKNIDQLNFELAALKLSDEERAIQIKLRGLTAKATDEERATIEAKVRALDTETAAMQRQQAMWDQQVKDANASDKLRKDNAEFIKRGDVQGGFNERLAETQDQLAAGIITPEQAKIEFDNLGKAYNEYFIDPAKSGVNSLSEFSVQAAHNMQSTLSDALFDPMQEGFDGMVDGFANAIKRMLSDAISAQLFNALLGKDFSKTGDLQGGLLSALGSGIAAYAGGGSTATMTMSGGPGWFGAKHVGGIIGQAGGSVYADPAIFSAATRYHSGGIAGLKPNEVPTVLMAGEEVLTQDDPRHRNNYTPAGGNTVEVHIHEAPGTKATTTSKQTNQGTQINVLIEQIENAVGANITRGAGLAPVLEKQYGLNRSAGSY
jgi:hypothetical protein